MANNFKNAVKKDIGETLVTAYTTPASTTTTLIGLSLANTTTSAITATVTLTDASTGVTVNLIKSAPVPAGSSLIVVGGDQKVILESSDIIKIQSDTTSSIDATLSMLEITA